ncbi:MAG: hypothetical protein LBH40_05370 [Alphaproteobacteria bacterium]|jgi:hypothetical protein|nr:hypothetical protein [Alphaproteobacteria bacterium]
MRKEKEQRERKKRKDIELNKKLNGIIKNTIERIGEISKAFPLNSEDGEKIYRNNTRALAILFNIKKSLKLSMDNEPSYEEILEVSPLISPKANRMLANYVASLGLLCKIKDFFDSQIHPFSTPASA